MFFVEKPHATTFHRNYCLFRKYNPLFREYTGLLSFKVSFKQTPLMVATNGSSSLHLRPPEKFNSLKRSLY